MNSMGKILIRLSFLVSAFIFNINNTNAQSPIIEFEQAMAQYKGKVVYLDFWASWCVPCRQSFPWMNSINKQYQQQGLRVLSVNLDANATLATKFLEKNPADFSIIYDAKGSLAKRFQLKGMPSSYLFNRQGELISTHIGFNDEKQRQYQAEIEQALAN